MLNKKRALILVLVIVIIIVLAFVYKDGKGSDNDGDSNNNGIVTTSNEDTSDIEDRTDKAHKTESSTATDDVYNKEALSQFFYETYKKSTSSDTVMQFDSFKECLAYEYGDIDSDGVDEVVCFSYNPHANFKENALITVKDGRFKVVKSDIKPGYGLSSQDFEIAGGFIVYSTGELGYGTDINTDYVYKLQGDRIVKIVELIRDGYMTLMKNNLSPFEGKVLCEGKVIFQLESDGDDEDKWRKFEYEYTETIEKTGEVIFKQVEEYKYLDDKNSYSINYIDQSSKAGSKGIAQVNMDDVYEIQNLTAGMKVEDYDLSALYLASNYIYYAFEGDIVLEGLVEVSDYDYEISMVVEKPVLSKKFRLTLDGDNYDYNPIRFASFDINLLSEDQIKYIREQWEKKNNNEPYESPVVRMRGTTFSSLIYYYSESWDLLEGITEVEWLSPEELKN